MRFLLHHNHSWYFTKVICLALYMEVIAIYCENNPETHKQTATWVGGEVEYLILKKIYVADYR